MNNKKGIFYGWWIVLATAITSFWIAGTYFFGFTAFVNPLVNTFGWSYFSVSLAISMRTVEGGILAPILGFVVDKIGPRKLAFLGGVVVGLGYIALSYIDSLALFYGVFAIMAIGSSCCASVIMTTAVANWFNRNIGRAMGLSTMGFGLGGLLLPVVVRLINETSLQTTFIIVGVGSILVIPLCALVFRHKPEQYGYLPDGDSDVPDDVLIEPHKQVSAKVDAEYGAKQVLKDKRFWFLCLAFGVQFTGYSSISLHILPFLSTELPEETAALAATFVPILSIPGRLLFGWLGDIFGRKHVLVATFIVQIISFVLFILEPSLGLIIGFVITFGMGYGGTMAIRPAIQREYFGRGSYGAIQGMLMTMMTVGGVVGPALTGWIVDTQGSYQLSWIIFAAALALSVPLIAVIRPPDKNSTSSPEAGIHSHTGF